ncbi:DUF4184 domain-containing protein [Clostridiaceae bacterium 14S0207]|nr:DUF4184 domain-containing protein [Clostridiaceae bacterium 14S0207]
MPFTFSHIAAVLPIKEKFNKYFNFTGLVLGSLAPDFQYFLNFKPMGNLGHTLVGFIVLNLPLCFLVAFLFHKIIKKCFILHMPTPFDRWYIHYAYTPWSLNSIKEIFIFIYSTLLGMLTHIVWDSFTHSTGKFVLLFPQLRYNIFILNYAIPIYKLLQHGSTLIGTFLLVIYMYKKRNLKRTPKFISLKNKLNYYIIIILNILLFIFIGFFTRHITVHSKSIGSLIITFLNGLFVGCILASINTKHY